MGLIGLGEERVQGDPRGPGGPPLDRPIVSPARDLVHFGLGNGVPAKDWTRQGTIRPANPKTLVHFAILGLAGQWPHNAAFPSVGKVCGITLTVAAPRAARVSKRSSDTRPYLPIGTFPHGRVS